MREDPSKLLASPPFTPRPHLLSNKVQRPKSLRRASRWLTCWHRMHVEARLVYLGVLVSARPSSSKSSSTTWPKLTVVILSLRVYGRDERMHFSVFCISACVFLYVGRRENARGQRFVPRDAGNGCNQIGWEQQGCFGLRSNE